MEHRLKCWPYFFNAILEDRKTFEIRFNDRDFQLGDTLLLREYDPHPSERGYTSRELRVRVTHMTEFMQQPGYVVMAVKKL